MTTKNWDDTTIGLFVTNESFRIDEHTSPRAWSWVHQAACRDVDPEEFFHTRMNVRLLNQVCGRCPVKDACLATATAHGERGWWGGRSETQRNRA